MLGLADDASLARPRVTRPVAETPKTRASEGPPVEVLKDVEVLEVLVVSNYGRRMDSGSMPSISTPWTTTA